MEIERDEQIREIAYRIWQEEGCPAGCEVEHWLKAQSIWQEKHRSKSKPKQSKPLKKPKTRKTAAAETKL